jgi:hypothetical protein
VAYGDRVSRVQAEFREFPYRQSLLRVRKDIEVIHVSRNRVLMLFPRAKQPVLKSLTAKRISLVAPGGRDLVKEWREPPGRRSSTGEG